MAKRFTTQKPSHFIEHADHFVAKIAISDETLAGLDSANPDIMHAARDKVCKDFRKALKRRGKLYYEKWLLTGHYHYVSWTQIHIRPL